MNISEKFFSCRFERNEMLENKIDKTLVYSGFDFTSIKVYLDELFYLKDKVDEGLEGDALDRLSRIVDCYRGYRYIIRLNDECRDYINSVGRYVSSIRSFLLGYDYPEVSVVKTIESLLLDNVKPTDKLQGIVCDKLNEFGVSFDCSCRDDNLRIFFPRHGVIIDIVNNVFSYDYDVSQHRLKVIINTLDYDQDFFDRVVIKFDTCYISERQSSGTFSGNLIFSKIHECYRLVIRCMEVIRKRRLMDVDKRLLDDLACINRELLRVDRLCVDNFYDRNDENIYELKRLASFIEETRLCWENDKKGYSQHSKKVIVLLSKIRCVVKDFFERKKNEVSLFKDISYSLGQIKESNALYVRSGSNAKTSDYAFGEENLSAILASNLRCMYRRKRHISVDCESRVGNGRSDVEIKYGGDVLGIVESKLVKEKQSISSSIVGGLDQLYERYSENKCIPCNVYVGLYLVVFSHDKKPASFFGKVKEGVDQYSERNNLSYRMIDQSEDSVKFVFKDLVDRSVFKGRFRVIEVVLCNLEIDYKESSKERRNVSKNRKQLK